MSTRIAIQQYTLASVEPSLPVEDRRSLPAAAPGFQGSYLQTLR
jgi:hypothetical protein